MNPHWVFSVVELSWNNSRTRVGVAELSAGRVAWARDAEAMSRLGNYSDFLLQSRIAGSPRLSSPSLLYTVFQAYLR